jgi:hypothetical protein
MERLKQFLKWTSVTGALFGAFVGGKADKYLETSLLPSGAKALLAFSVIVLVYVIIGECAEYTMGSLRWLRRLILANQYVEGTWMDVVRDGDSITHIGVLRITILNGDLHVSGDNYRTNGLLVDSFHSTMLEFSWPLVRFVSSSDRIGSAPSYSEVRFDPRNGVPTRYKGFFQDVGGSRFDYVGWRINDVEVLRQLDDPMKVTKVVRELAATLMEPPQHRAEIAHGDPVATATQM